MDQALLLSAVLMGLAGTPHCLAMCGAACAAAGPGFRGQLPLHLGRLVAYSAAGALAAASVGSLAALGQAVAGLRPIWMLVHMDFHSCLTLKESAHLIAPMQRAYLVE